MSSDAAMQIERISWRGVPAWLVQGTVLEAVVTEVGGHLACLRRRGEILNPLWQPPWAPGDPRRARASGAWGDGPEASLLASIVGSNLCLDRFGPPWPGEKRPVHGETSGVTWRHRGGACFAAVLPQAGLEVRRELVFAGATLQLTVAVRHASAAPREVEWCEHVSLGDPFLTGATCSAGIDAAWKAPWPEQDDSAFQAVPPLGAVPIAAALGLPAADDPPCGDVLAGHVNSGWWAVANQQCGRQLTAHWDQREFPWLTLWTQHRSRRAAPWHGRVRARGLEISSKPFPEGRPPAERHPIWQGRSTVSLLPPGVWTRRTISLTWEATPPV
jgi:hypothetical protein